MTVVGLRQPAMVRRPFYLVMALLIAAVFVAGFSTTVPGDFAPKPGLPLLLHLHGAIFTLWVLLFVAQPAFISQGSLALHRKVGWVGVGLVVAMMVMGEAATYFSIRNNREIGIFPSGVFLVMNGVGILVFAAIVGAGVALRRQAEWHKRLMLIAAISILGPALGRLFGTLGFGASTGITVTGVTFAFALAGPTADLIVRRRIHPAYAWGGRCNRRDRRPYWPAGLLAACLSGRSGDQGQLDRTSSEGREAPEAELGFPPESRR